MNDFCGVTAKSHLGVPRCIVVPVVLVQFCNFIGCLQLVVVSNWLFTQQTVVRQKFARTCANPRERFAS